MKRIVLVIFVILTFVPQVADAQCAMCRAVLESEGNIETAEGHQ